MKKLFNNWGYRFGWFVTIFFAFTNLVLAAGGSPTLSSSIRNPIATDTFIGLLALVLKIIIDIGLPIVVIAIIFVGFSYVMAQGNSGKLEKAHSAFLWVMVGAAIVLGSQVIITIIQNTVDQIKK